MRRTMSIVLVGLGAACSGASPPADPTALTQPIAQNVTISQITMLQALEVPIMTGGNPAPAGDIPLIALRDSLLRVFVTPGNNWTPHAVTARARLVTTSPMGQVAQVFSTTTTVGGASTESDLTSTIQIPIPGIALENGSSVTVVINDTTGDPPDIAQSYARWPSDGSLADLGVQDGGDHLRVMIVPVQYEADGSGRLPDTSDAQMEVYRERFLSLYPTAEVDMSVHAPWPTTVAVSGLGSGISTLLQELSGLRASDQPDPDVYYYAAFEATPDFASYCGGGCITGLSTIGAPTSVGIGYTGNTTAETAVHEVGHAHGRYHAPCSQGITITGVDPNWPTASQYASAHIGVWGYDSFNQVMVDPTATYDMMSYCGPDWISDYHYNLIFNRVRVDNGYLSDWTSGSPSAHARFALAPVMETGGVHVSTSFTREPWVSLGEPHEVAWNGGRATAYYFPLDHLPGGMLYVPDAVPASARVAALRPAEPTTMLTR